MIFRVGPFELDRSSFFVVLLLSLLLFSCFLFLVFLVLWLLLLLGAQSVEPQAGTRPAAGSRLRPTQSGRPCGAEVEGSTQGLQPFQTSSCCTLIVSDCWLHQSHTSSHRRTAFWKRGSASAMTLRTVPRHHTCARLKFLGPCGEHSNGPPCRC